MPGNNPESALHIAAARRSRRHIALAWRRARAHERNAIHRFLGRLSECKSDKRGLVEPALPQTPAVEWHGNDDVRVGDQVAARTEQPARERGDEIKSVGAFERKYGVAARIVVPHEGPRSVESGKPLLTGGAERAGSRVELERKSANRAKRIREKSDTAPAAGANVVRLGDRGAAAGAKRRKNKVKRAPPGDPQSVLPSHVGAQKNSRGGAEWRSRAEAGIHKSEVRICARPFPFQVSVF